MQALETQAILKTKTRSAQIFPGEDGPPALSGTTAAGGGRTVSAGLVVGGASGVVRRGANFEGTACDATTAGLAGANAVRAEAVGMGRADPGAEPRELGTAAAPAKPVEPAAEAGLDALGAATTAAPEGSTDPADSVDDLELRNSMAIPRTSAKPPSMNAHFAPPLLEGTATSVPAGCFAVSGVNKGADLAAIAGADAGGVTWAVAPDSNG